MTIIRISRPITGKSRLFESAAGVVGLCRGVAGAVWRCSGRRGVQQDLCLSLCLSQDYPPAGRIHGAVHAMARQIDLFHDCQRLGFSYFYTAMGCWPISIEFIELYSAINGCHGQRAG